MQEKNAKTIINNPTLNAVSCSCVQDYLSLKLFENKSTFITGW